jgi:hypothetical protein
MPSTPSISYSVEYTLAFHFNFTAARGLLWDLPERVGLLERTLRALEPLHDLKCAASLRLNNLFSSTGDFKRSYAAWIQAVRESSLIPCSSHPDLMDTFEHVLVVTVSGGLGKQAARAVTRLARYRSYPLLFTVAFPEQAPPAVRSRYLGNGSVLIGTLAGVSREVNLSGEAIFLEEVLEPMWARRQITATYTPAALSGVPSLVQPLGKAG